MTHVSSTLTNESVSLNVKPRYSSTAVSPPYMARFPRWMNWISTQRDNLNRWLAPPDPFPTDVLRYIVCKLGGSEIFGHISLSWNEVAVRRKGPDAECDEARIRTAGGFCRVIKYFIEEALSKLPLIRSRSWRCFRGTASIFIPRWLRSNPLSWYFFHLPCLYDFLNTILAAFTREDYI